MGKPRRTCPACSLQLVPCTLGTGSSSGALRAAPTFPRHRPDLLCPALAASMRARAETRADPACSIPLWEERPAGRCRRGAANPACLPRPPYCRCSLPCSIRLSLALCVHSQPSQELQHEEAIQQAGAYLPGGGVACTAQAGVPPTRAAGAPTTPHPEPITRLHPGAPNASCMITAPLLNPSTSVHHHSLLPLSFPLQSGPCQLCGAKTASSWRHIPSTIPEAAGLSSCECRLCCLCCCAARCLQCRRSAQSGLGGAWQGSTAAATHLHLLHSAAPLPPGNACYVYILKRVKDDEDSAPAALEACRSGKRARVTPQHSDQARPQLGRTAAGSSLTAQWSAQQPADVPELRTLKHCTGAAPVHQICTRIHSVQARSVTAAVSAPLGTQLGPPCASCLVLCHANLPAPCPCPAL